MLQEENESMLEKVQYFLLGFSQQSKFIFLFHLAIVNYILEFDIQLRLEEERYKEAEARVKELEKQVIAFFFFFHAVRGVLPNLQNISFMGAVTWLRDSLLLYIP